ncbi:Protein ENL [Pseudolycoriella hygida]|uniref:Protein ENL n=1 Tax=Pseudolycoriella hygida TaxID=35572 RepID=A0A9Q0MSR2_9DIPT|nr:Protein ENL [Pseudolycoriella hygida]
MTILSQQIPNFTFIITGIKIPELENIIFDDKQHYKVVFEIGHFATLKSKVTPEGFTHDWELYVRGCDSADISHYIDKVVFNLHDSFPKFKRVFKEPPYHVKESGYAGFVLPIDIYFKNRDDPKKITYNYDLSLQNTGTITNVDKKTHTFKNPSEDFRRKLLKGGGFAVNNFPSGSEIGGKKCKTKADDTKVANTYSNLFGPSGSKGAAKVSPEAKNKSASTTSAKQLQKTEKTSRDKSDKDKKEKSKHNSPNKDKTEARDASRKTHEDKHKKREDKNNDKTHAKERGRSTDKMSNTKQCPSPKRMAPSPRRVSPNRSTSALSKNDDSVKSFSKQADPVDRPSSSAKKPKKDRKEKNSDKERDRERSKDQKQKEERPSSKVSDKIDPKKEKDTGSRNQKDKTKANDEDAKVANTSPPKKPEQTQSSQLPQQQTKINPLSALLNEIEEKASSDSDDDSSKPSMNRRIVDDAVEGAPQTSNVCLDY